MSKEKRKLMLYTFIIACIGALLSIPFFAGAGSLEPPPEATAGGNPQSTMKTLDEIPPTWSQELRADDGDSEGCDSSRFKCVFNREAVLDKETGLVWKRSPGYTGSMFFIAENHCYSLTLANRKGWRLPTVEELTSLVDPTQADPALPSGHPFTTVWSFYWSSTTYAYDLTPMARGVDFADGRNQVFVKSTIGGRWCVRGGHGHNAY